MKNLMGIFSPYLKCEIENDRKFDYYSKLRRSNPTSIQIANDLIIKKWAIANRKQTVILKILGSDKL